MPERQPIETAPRDGTVIRLHIPGHPEIGRMRAKWNADIQRWLPWPNDWTCGWRDRHFPNPTHWEPA